MGRRAKKTCLPTLSPHTTISHAWSAHSMIVLLPLVVFQLDKPVPRAPSPCDLDEVVLALVRAVRVAVRRRGAKEVRRSTRRHMMRPYILELVACANFSLIGNGPGAVPALLREHPWRVNEILELA